MDSARNRGFMDRTMGWIVLAALAAGLGLWAAQKAFAPRPPAVPAPAARPATQAVRLFAEPRELPDFRLDTAGGALSQADLAGHWTVVFLGFTHCPDICPTTLATLAGAQKAWRALPEATRPRVLFVSVDPARDTPATVARYARHFHADTLAATAAEPALADFVQSLGMVYMRVDAPDGGYMMDHSSTLVVLDPQGRQAGLIRPPFDADAIGAELAHLSKAAP